MIRDIRRAVKALSPAGIGRHSELVDLLYAQKETHEALCKYITASNNASQLLLKFGKSQDDFTIREVSVRQAELHWLADKIAAEYADQYLQYRKAFKEVLAEQKLLDEIQKVKEMCEAKVAKLRRQAESSKKRSDATRAEAMQAEVAMAVSAAEESQTKYQIAKTKFEVYKAGKVKAALLTLADSQQLYHQRCGHLATTQQTLSEFIPDVPTPMTPEDMKDMDDKGVQLVRDVAEKLNMQNPPKEGGQEEGATLHTYRPLTYQPSLTSMHMVQPASPKLDTEHVQDATTTADEMGVDRISPKGSLRKNPFDEDVIPPTSAEVNDNVPSSASPQTSRQNLAPEATAIKTTPSRPPPPTHTRDASPSTRDDQGSASSGAPPKRLLRRQSGKAPPPARPPPPRAATLPNRPPAPLPRPDLMHDDSLDYSEPYTQPDNYIDPRTVVGPTVPPQQQAAQAVQSTDVAEQPPVAKQPPPVPQQPSTVAQQPPSVAQQPPVAMPTEVPQQPSQDYEAIDVDDEMAEAARQPSRPSHPPRGSLARKLSEALMKRQVSGESVGEEASLERSVSVTSSHSYVEIVDGVPQEESPQNGEGEYVELNQEPLYQQLQGASSHDSPDKVSGDSPDQVSSGSKHQGIGDSKDQGTGDSKDQGTGDSKDQGTGDSKDQGTGDSKDQGTGDSKDQGTGDSPDQGIGDSSVQGIGDSASQGVGDSTDQGSGGTIFALVGSGDSSEVQDSTIVEKDKNRDAASQRKDLNRGSSETGQCDAVEDVAKSEVKLQSETGAREA